jgi:hypothetical protein
MSELEQSQFNGWAKVEVMGRQTHIGFVRTEAYGQAVMFRVDTPELPERDYVLKAPAYVTTDSGAQVWTPAGATVRRGASLGCTVLIGAGSIYRILPCNEATALQAIEADQRAELKLIAVPQVFALAATVGEISHDQDDDDDDDDDDPYEDRP